MRLLGTTSEQIVCDCDGFLYISLSFHLPLTRPSWFKPARNGSLNGQMIDTWLYLRDVQQRLMQAHTSQNSLKLNSVRTVRIRPTETWRPYRSRSSKAQAVTNKGNIVSYRRTKRNSNLTKHKLDHTSPFETGFGLGWFLNGFSQLPAAAGLFPLIPPPLPSPSQILIPHSSAPPPSFPLSTTTFPSHNQPSTTHLHTSLVSHLHCFSRIAI